MIVLLAAVALGIVRTGPVVAGVAGPLGVGSSAQTIWNLARWPVMLAAVIAMFGVRYHTAPNVQLPGFKWVTPGDLRVGGVDRGVGAVRALRGELRFLRQGVRHAGRDGRVHGLGCGSPTLRCSGGWS
jgi:hypothetical protein